jgi:phosphoglycerate kinase
VEEARLAPVAERLADLLEREVFYRPTDGVLHPHVEQRCAALEPGHVVLLENLRFDPREEANDRGFAEELTTLAEIYVDDAFGAVHRAHARPSESWRIFLVAPRASDGTRDRGVRSCPSPERPFVAIWRRESLREDRCARNLLPRVDRLAIGRMMFTFLRALGHATGRLSRRTLRSRGNSLQPDAVRRPSGRLPVARTSRDTIRPDSVDAIPADS